MRCMVFGVVLLCGVSGVAQADERADQVFAIGQFTGAATFCGVPRQEVNELAKTILDALDVDSSGPNPMMSKFTEGVTAGVKEQKDTPQATCDEVKQGFEQMKAKTQ